VKLSRSRSHWCDHGLQEEAPVRAVDAPPEQPAVAVKPELVPEPPKEKPFRNRIRRRPSSRLLADLRPLLVKEYGTVAHHIIARYVRRDGTLDPKYGELLVATGTSNDPVDDPKRRSVPRSKVHARAGGVGGLRAVHVQERRVDQVPVMCQDGEALTTRCTIAEIWNRAIEHVHAPPDALAVIDRDTDPNAGSSRSRTRPARSRSRPTSPMTALSDQRSILPSPIVA